MKEQYNNRMMSSRRLVGLKAIADSLRGEVNEDGYDLLSIGPDGDEDTDDDITNFSDGTLENATP